MPCFCKNNCRSILGYIFFIKKKTIWLFKDEKFLVFLHMFFRSVFWFLASVQRKFSTELVNKMLFEERTKTLKRLLIQITTIILKSISLHIIHVIV